MEHIHKFALVLKQMEPVFWSVLLCMQICSHNSSLWTDEARSESVIQTVAHVCTSSVLHLCDPSIHPNHTQMQRSYMEEIHPVLMIWINEGRQWQDGRRALDGQIDGLIDTSPGSSLLSLPPHPPRLTLLSASLSPHSRCFLSSSSR